MRKKAGNYKLCGNCGMAFYVEKHRLKMAKFCSHKCYSVNLTTKTSWNKGKPMTKEHRQKLSEAKLKNPVRYWKGKHKELRGNKHWNWRGGVTPVNEKIHKSMEYKLWRKAVYERDNYTCIWGGKEHGSKLHADHIKPFSLFPELRFAIDNGRTLCADCHRKTDTFGYNVNHYKDFK